MVTCGPRYVANGEQGACHDRHHPCHFHRSASVLKSDELSFDMFSSVLAGETRRGRRQSGLLRRRAQSPLWWQGPAPGGKVKAGRCCWMMSRMIKPRKAWRTDSAALEKLRGRASSWSHGSKKPGGILAKKQWAAKIKKRTGIRGGGCRCPQRLGEDEKERKRKPCCTQGSSWCRPWETCKRSLWLAS